MPISLYFPAKKLSKFDMRRAVLAVVCLLSPASRLNAQATLSKVVGVVEKFHSAKGYWLQVTDVPQPLAEGDGVRTSTDSMATVNFPDGTRFELGPHASVILKEARPTGILIFLNIGAIRSWVQKLLPGRAFSIQTETAQSAVRGTQFEVSFNEQRETVVSVMEGVVNVRTVLGEEIDLEAGRTIRVLPDRPLDLPGVRPAGPKQTKKPTLREKLAAAFGPRAGEEFRRDASREVGLGMSKDAVQAAAAVEARLAEYQEGKTMIDVFGKRVRIEEYILRSAADTFKFVVLNSRSDSFNFFYYLAQFNQTLPATLSTALRYLNGKAGTAPDFFITNFETGRSNTIDAIKENGTGGHLVNTPLAQNQVVYDPGTNTFNTFAAGTPFWSTLFNNYSYKIDGAEKFGWQPTAGVVNITAYDYVATGFNTRILGGGALCGAAGCATAGPVTCTALACENAARPNVISNPQGPTNLDQQVTISYAGNGTAETYNFFIVGDKGNLATVADFNGITNGDAYKNTLLQFNYEQSISASEFAGRKIDLVVEPKILVESGVIQ